MPSVEELLLRLRTEGFDEADAKLSAIQRRLRDLNRENAEAKVTVDDAAARAKLDALGRTRHARINVDTDTSSVSAAFGRLKNDLSDIGQRASSLPRWLAATLPVTIPLVATLAQAAAGAGALGIAAGGAGTAFGVLGLAVKQSLAGAQTQQQAVTRAQQAVTRAEQAYQVTLQTGTRRQQQAAEQRVRAAEANLAATQRQAGAEVNAASQTIAAWNSVKTTFASVMSAGVTATEHGLTAILGAIRGDLPLLKQPFQVLGGAVRDALTNPQIQAGLRQFVTSFGQIVTASAPLAGPILRALIDIGQILANLARAAMPALVSHVERFVNWLDRMVGLTGDQDHMRQVIDRMVASFDAVWRAVVQVATALAPLFNFNSPVGQGMLTMIGLIARLVGGFVSLLNALGPVGQIIGAGLGIAFIVGKFGSWISVIKDTIGILKTLRNTLAGLDIAQALSGGGGGGGGLLGRLRGAFGRGGAGAAASEGEQLALPGLEGAGGGLLSRLGGGLGGLLGRIGIGGAAAEGGIALTGPIGLALAGVGTLIGLAVVHWHTQIGQGISSAWARAVSLTRQAAGGIAAAASYVMGRISGTVRRDGALIGTAARWAWSHVASAGRDIGGAVSSAARWVMQRASGGVRGAGGLIGQAASWAWRHVSDAARGVGGLVSSAASWVMRRGHDAIQGAGSLIGSAASWVWHHVSDAASSVGGLVSSAASWVMHRGHDAIQGAGDLISSVSSWVWHHITGALSDLGGLVSSLASRMIGLAASGIRDGAGLVSSAMGSIGNLISDAFSSFEGWAARAGSNIVSTLSNAISGGISWAKGAISDIGNAISSILPFSEPRDPNSPLRGLARAGRAIVANIAAGITAGPVQQALGHALALPALPNASMGHVPMPTVAGAATATATGMPGRPVTVNLNFDASVHPADPAVQRRIARTVSSALRTNLSQHPPVRA